MTTPPPGPDAHDGPWREDATHRAWLTRDATRQLDFFRASLRSGPGFHTLAHDGTPLPDSVQELHTTTRLVHSYALGKLAGAPDCDAIIDKGMDYLWSHHRDTAHGGYLWSLDGDTPKEARKMAYGHVFVLLAASSAKLAGHPDADRLLADVAEVLDSRFWEEGPGRFADEFERDWTVFSDYRGMNANMHGVEALLAAHEVTGEGVYLDRAGRILDFFLHEMAPASGWRIPEHYTGDWKVDTAFHGDPMFRPAGSTPGHSFEMARLLLQYWDLRGRPEDGALDRARRIVDQAVEDAWDEGKGGLIYTLTLDGNPDIRARYWWPVTEAIGVLASLIKIDPRPQDEDWYRRMWHHADAHLVDHAHGGWFPELDAENRPTATIFHGKPDIYHALQADLFPLTDRLSHMAADLSLA